MKTFVFTPVILVMCLLLTPMEILSAEESETETLDESAATVDTSSADKSLWDRVYSKSGAVFQLNYAYDIEDDGADEDLWDLRWKLSGYLELKPWNKSKLYLSAITLQNIAGREPDSTVKLEDIWRVPNEAYFMQSIWKFDTYLGLQVNKWGVNSYLSPTDNINPLELRGFIDPDKEDAVIPIPMFKTQLFFTDSIYLEGVYIPLFYKSQYHVFDTDFALCQDKDVCPVQENEQFSEMKIKDDNQYEYGARLRVEVGDFTVEGSYFNTREDFPVFFSMNNPYTTYTDVIIDKRYFRYEIYGGGVGWHYKAISLRGEYAYFPERKYTTFNGAFYNLNGDFCPLLETDTSSSYSWAAEAEYTPSARFYFMLGYQETQLQDHRDDFLLTSDSTKVGLFLHRSTFFREKLQLLMGTMYFFEDDDYIILPRIAYAPTDHLKFTVGANLLQGERANTESLGGVAPVSLYTDSDQIFAGVRISY